jgi:hypothetical protein
MIIIVSSAIVLVVSLVLGVLLFLFCNVIDLDDDMATGIEMFLILVTVLSLIVFCIAVPRWIGAGHKAEIINRKLGTSYTQEEVFWAGRTIEMITEGKRYRVDLETGIREE